MDLKPALLSPDHLLCWYSSASLTLPYYETGSSISRVTATVHGPSAQTVQGSVPHFWRIFKIGRAVFHYVTFWSADDQAQGTQGSVCSAYTGLL
jgi:hypothetical protein